MEQQRFTYLLEQYRTGQLTPAEGEELLKTVQTDDDAWLVDNIASLMAMEAEIPAVVDEQVVQSNINRVLAIDKGARVRKVRTYRWAAAAAIALLLAGAGYTLLKQNPSVKDTVATVPAPDVAPATGKATLVLADGSSVALDEDSVRAIRQGILQKGES
ncbi:hypothetical protein MKQ68_05405 [Chitinophaga horti]|uniref:Anti-sigma factor n=1 Tax=Chitinophaga horti TaxID=2920382 RepID=A0ABY6J8C1_9BACT|nr:hypothetical protein [Chitinophaga horti]UYQ94526.1 hypothetical protein MKQ68_05405 [Chitinophaga horti]